MADRAVRRHDARTDHRSQHRDEFRGRDRDNARWTHHRRRVLQRRARPLLREPAGAGHRRARHRAFRRLGAHRIHVQGVSEPGEPAAPASIRSAGSTFRRSTATRISSPRRPRSARRCSQKIGTDPNYSGYIVRDAERVLHRAAGHGDRRVPGRHDPRVPALEQSRRFQPPLHDRSGDQDGDAREGLHRRRATVPTRSACAPADSRMPDPQFAASAASPFAPGCDGVAGHRRVVRERRSRADGRRQSDQPVEPRRRLAAGPLVERRRARIAGRLFVRRRPHVGALGGDVLALRRRQCSQRRQLRARQRPMGHVRARWHRVLDFAVVQRPGKPARLVQRRPGRALDRRRQDVERCRRR